MKYIRRISSAKGKDLLNLYNEISKSEFISYIPKYFQDNVLNFQELSEDNQRRFLIDLLDKNMLYVNYCDIDDNDFEVTEQEKAFTKSFYGDV